MSRFVRHTRSRLSRLTMGPVLKVIERALEQASALRLRDEKSAFLKGNFAPVSQEIPYNHLAQRVLGLPRSY